MMDFSDLDYYFDINGLSYHLGTNPGIPEDYKYNEVNPGLGVTVEDVNDKVVKALMAGRYKNSFNQPSYYAGGSLAKRFGDDYYADIGLMGGVATGYENVQGSHNGKTYEFNEYNKFHPMAGLMMNLGKKDLGRIGIKYIPTKEGVIMMNLGIPIR